MKKIAWILVVIAMIVGCSEARNPLLKEAAEIVHQRPDSARVLINKVDTTALSEADKMEYRLLTLFEELQAKILLHKPVYGAVEKLFFSNNVTTAISVGQARGIVLLCMAQAHIPIAEFTPMEIKQAVVGYGGAEKKQVQMMVKAILGLDEIPKPDDAADALAAAITCSSSLSYLKLTV